MSGELRFGRVLPEGSRCCGKPRGCGMTHDGCLYLRHPWKRAMLIDDRSAPCQAEAVIDGAAVPCVRLHGHEGGCATVRDLLELLRDGPRSSAELMAGLGLAVAEAAGLGYLLKRLELDEVVSLDADRFPDEYVPGNPLVVRLRGDGRGWEGWRGWNV